MITTVGPYLQHGEPLVAACAEAGTDYVDLTGEPEFVDRMYLAHHATAERTGARIVHACGFDSIPHDLGALHAVQQLAATGPGQAARRGPRRRDVLRRHLPLRDGRVRRARAIARGAQRAAPGRAAPRGPPGRARSRGKPHRDPVLGYWLLPLPTIDPMVVARSGAALAAYGPDFRYSHYAGMKTADLRRSAPPAWWPGCS